MDASKSQASRGAIFARALRARRRALCLTQTEPARLAGCGPDFIYDVEAGKPSLRLDKLIDLLAVLGLELALRPGRGALVVVPELDAKDEPTSPRPKRARARSR